MGRIVGANLQLVYVWLLGILDVFVFERPGLVPRTKLGHDYLHAYSVKLGVVVLDGAEITVHALQH